MYKYDYIQFIKHLTFKKILNALILYLSYGLSLFTKKPIHFGLPLSLSVEPLNYCNLSCSECPVGNKTLKRKAKILSYTLYTKIIDELSPYLCNLFLYFQGEPFLHPNIFDMIAYANAHNIYTVIATNANCLSDEMTKKIVVTGLDKLIISIDGTDNDTYQKYRRGGNFDQLLTVIKQIIAYKIKFKNKLPFIELQFLVFSFNEHQIDDFLILGKQLGADSLSIKTAQIYDYNNKTDLIPTKKNGAGMIKKTMAHIGW